MSTTFPTLALALLLACGASAQSVFVVAPVLGPGVFSTDIQPAINAAAEGDLVLVKAGTYSGFTINAKSVSVVADAGASVVANGFVFVSGLAASQHALLQGLTLHGDNSNPAIVLLNDPGAIWIESCDVTGGTQNGTGLVAVSVNSCPSVVIERSIMTGGSGAVGNTNDMGAPALHVAGPASSVAVGDSQCIGGNGAPTFLTGLPNSGYGGPGLRIVTGSTFASGTSFQGGNGAPPVPHLFAGGGAAPGINTQGALTLLQCTSTPGITGNPALPVPPPIVVGFGGSLQTLPGVARHFATTSPMREGQTATITAGGLAGEFAGFLFAPSPGPVVLMLPFEGALALSFANVDAFALGTIPAGGTLSTPIVVPNLPPTLQSGTFWCQSVFFDAQLTYALIGPASAVVVLDSTL